MSDLQNQLERFRHELDELSDRLPLSDSLVADAISRGRRRRRRHRLALAAQGISAIAVVTAVVGAAALWPRSNPRELNSSATEQSSTRAAASSSPAAAAPTRAHVSATLARLLAAYGTVTVRIVPPPATSGKGATSLKTPASAIAHLATSHGTVAIAATAITVAHPHPGTGDFACPVGPQVSCNSRRVGDDVVTAAFNPAGSPDSASIWTVLVGHSDGRAIQIDEWNGAQPKGPADPHLHGTPPLSLNRLQAIAANPAW